LNRLQQIEQEVLEEGRELTRRMLEERLQAHVEQMGAVSPSSGLKLKKARRIDMKLHTVCGVVELRVWYGYCSHSGRNMTVARESWGLGANQRYSAEFEKRICYTATQTTSYEKASAMVGCWGSSISDDGVHACIQRKGKEAAGSTPPAPEQKEEKPYTMIVMMDGWMARHRGSEWGMKPAEKSADRVHWHEIKSAVIFRLDQRAETAGGRRMLIEKHVVAAPAETTPTDFSEQVHSEAMRLGLAKAEAVYVIQDGAIWLWNLFADRFSSCASGVLDFYHASHYLWELAHHLFGQGSSEAQEWASELLHQLRHGKETRVLRSLRDLANHPPEQDPETHEIISHTANYFEKHEEHIHYEELNKQGIPIGSGAIESQCSQFQGRFKNTGQFWSDEGFANLLSIDLRVRNDELQYLWAA